MNFKSGPRAGSIARAGLLAAALLSSLSVAQTLDPKDIRAARDYSVLHNGLSLIVRQNGTLLSEDYDNGFTRLRSHPLMSATKSFSGILLAALIEDGRISSFDEPVSRAIEEWRTDPAKKDITYRELLSLTSGLDTGTIGRVIPYAEAVALPSLSPRGTAFSYGPSPFQVFGEAVKRILEGESALEYLTRRVFRPIGLEPTGWRLGRDGNPNLASGADLRAEEWAKFGEFIRMRGVWAGKPVVKASLIEELLKPSGANPSYGVSFWLSADPAEDDAGAARPARPATTGQPVRSPFPFRVILAAGAGKQRLYVIDDLGLVVVRQGRASAFDDAEFLKRLLASKLKAPRAS